MPSSPIISVRNIGKKYKLGATLGGRNYKTLRDVLTQVAFGPFQKLSAAFRKEPFTGGKHSSPNNPITQSPNNSITKSPTNPKNFWALKDISFDVQQGEIVGIIGANGAGKSTLLKILCGITEPTEGEIHIKGRIASLLEVGTGFHPELSGRENIFMNGAILGMTKTEIQSKFDEIVAFAEVEKFIDTPVKRYSSGMYVRLAFAVAAHLEPEILLVDEVLAVGDAAFQRKCLGKMGDVSKEGRTVLFVSHNMAMIRTLCDRVILLNGGNLIADGSKTEVIDFYLLSLIGRQKERCAVNFSEDITLKAQIINASICGTNGQHVACYDVFDQVKLQVSYIIRERIEGVAVIAVVCRNRDVLFVSFDTDACPELLGRRDPGMYKTTVNFPTPLKAGQYSIELTLGVLNGGGIDTRKEALSFTIDDRSFNSSMCSYASQRVGVMAAHLEWRTVREN